MAKKTTSRNLYKSFGLSDFTEQQFNKCIKKTIKELQKKCDPVVEKHENEVYVTSGPVTYVFKQNGKLGYQLKPKKNIFNLFQSDKIYSLDYKEFTRNLFLQILEEEKPNYKIFDVNTNTWKVEKIVKFISTLAPKPGKKMSDLNRIFGSFVWKEFDDEARGIAIKAIGMGVNSFDVSMIAQNIDEVRGVFKTTPGVISLWLYIRQKHFNKTHNRYIDSSLFFDRKKNIDIDLYDYNIHGNGIVYECKQFLKKEKAYSKPVWKMICKIKPRWMRSILAKCGCHQIGKMFNLLGEIGYIPRFTVLNDFVTKGLIYEGRDYLETYIYFLKVAFKSSFKRLAREQWSDILLVVDWIRDEHVVLDRNQRNASWDWFMRQQEKWHYQESLQRREREIARRNSGSEKDKKSQTWDSLLESYTINGYDIVPITTAIGLFDEGEAMDHCVGGAYYRYSCADGESQIFSIRKNNKSLVTVQITRSFKDKWQLNQVHGCHNKNKFIPKDLKKELKRITGRILSRYNNAQEKYDKEVEKKLKEVESQKLELMSA